MLPFFSLEAKPGVFESKREGEAKRGTPDTHTLLTSSGWVAMAAMEAETPPR